MSPSTARAMYENGFQSDFRSVLPAISVPTLVLHRAWGNARQDGLTLDVAKRIATARLVELPGRDLLAYVGR